MKNETKYELDDAYIRRCHKRLKEWGAPLSGWYCSYVYDVADGDDEASADDLVTCELCKCQKVRYVHVMCHKEYFEPLEVGCVCAGVMEGNILAAKEREQLMKNRSKRKQHFPNRRWYKDFPEGCYLVYQRKLIRIRKVDESNYAVSVGQQLLTTYHGMPITNFNMAAYAAFDVVDPVEKYTS